MLLGQLHVCERAECVLEKEREREQVRKRRTEAHPCAPAAREAGIAREAHVSMRRGGETEKETESQGDRDRAL